MGLDWSYGMVRMLEMIKDKDASEARIACLSGVLDQIR